MRKYRPALSTLLSVLFLTGLLLSPVLTGYAQQDQDWTTPINLSLSGLATNPILVIDSQGSLHALWVDAVDGYKYSRSDDNGLTWSVPQTAAFPFGPKDPSPTLLADPSGAIHIFWIDGDGGLSYGQTTPLNLMNPAQWLVTRRLASDVINFDVIIDTGGALHLAYIHGSSSFGNPAGVFYMHSTSGGWTQAKELYESEYFRSAKPSDSHLGVAASITDSAQRVFVTWDNRFQKRVFMAISENGGVEWDQAKEILGPQDTGGTGSPFNLNVAAVQNRILLLWQVGEPGSGRCSVFSRWSTDAGKHWAEIVSVLGVSTDCPDHSKFIVQQTDYIVLMMTGQGDPTLVAWDGKQWSDPQTQTRLPAISNPLTYDAILLGCRFDLVHQNRLYVVGCDDSGGGDTWFLSRTLDPVKNWFSPPEAWSAPVLIAGDSEKISSLSSVADAKGVLHSMWAQSSQAPDGSQTNAIEYAQWDGEEWTRPDAVISGLKGIPMQISATISGQDKLLITWVDGTGGELFFSWVNLESANLASEWAAPVGLPTPSNLVASPHMAVDGSGRIIMAYAIPLNEDRGIYILQSSDNGKSWSSPGSVFDAVAAQWEAVGEPKISLDEDGGLHIIFQRHSARSGESLGLFYSHSVDGGATWSDPQIISEANIQWSDMISYDQHTVHVFWQEYDGLVYANLSQASLDGGNVWNGALNITGVNGGSTPVALAADSAGIIHFIQLLDGASALTVKQDDLTLQDWAWNGSGWIFASDRKVSIRGDGIHYSVAAGITSAGILIASISAEYSDPENKIQDEIQTFNRYLGDLKIVNGPSAALIPTPAAFPSATAPPDVQATQPPDTGVLYDDNVATTATQRNLAGVVIIGIALVVTAFLLFRGRSSSSKK